MTGDVFIHFDGIETRTLDITFTALGVPLTFQQDDLPAEGRLQLSYELDADQLILVSLNPFAPLPTEWERIPEE